MSINFGLWLTALQRPIKLSEKSEWDKLDFVTRWLIATRGTVTQLTVFACAIAGLLAWRAGSFSWLPWLVMTVGLYLAHSTENLLNDYIDFTRGIDEDNYYRAQYGIHPLVHGFWSTREWLAWFLTAGVLATLAGAFILVRSHFSPIVIGLFAFGAVMIPLPTVSATSVPRKAPRKFITAAMINATRGVSARVETEVAIALAASWKPFV